MLAGRGALAAGRGGPPSEADVDWLARWAGEMGGEIAHASVQIMEVREGGRGRGACVVCLLLGRQSAPPLNTLGRQSAPPLNTRPLP